MAGNMLIYALLVVGLSSSALTASVPNESEEVTSKEDEDLTSLGSRKQRFEKIFAWTHHEKKYGESTKYLANEIYDILSASQRASTCTQVPNMHHTQLPSKRLPTVGLGEYVTVDCEPGYKTSDGLDSYDALCGDRGEWSRKDSCPMQTKCPAGTVYLAETGKSYKLFEEKKHIKGARTACAADGGQLADHVTPDVLWLLINLSGDDGKQNTYVDISTFASADGSLDLSAPWKNGDGSTARDIPWCRNEPTNFFDEYCVESFRDSRCLNNAKCNLEQRFLCQYDCKADDGSTIDDESMMEDSSVINEHRHGGHHKNGQ